MVPDQVFRFSKSLNTELLGTFALFENMMEIMELLADKSIHTALHGI